MKLFLALLLMSAGAAFSQPVSIQDTLFLPNGQTYSGSLSISWPVSFVGGDGRVMTAGPAIPYTVTNGVLNISLEANSTATPANTSYSVSYRPTGSGAISETWIVPYSASPVNLPTVRVAQPPSPSFLIALSQLSRSGASNGWCPVWNTAANAYLAAVCGSGSGITALTTDVVATGPGSAVATVKGINSVPLCTGFTPIAGQALTYSTSLSPNPCYTGKTGVQISAPDYNFALQSPSGTLTAATPATVTLTPVPLGVNGTDTGHWLYLPTCSGGAQAVLITGGTAVSGSASGTITFTPTNSCTAGWTISSATTGLQEAVNVALAAAGGQINIPPGTYNLYAPVSVSIAGGSGPHSIIFAGQGYDVYAAATRIINLGSGNAFTVVSNNQLAEIAFRDLIIIGSPNGLTGTASLDGINCTNCSGLRIDHVTSELNRQRGLYCVDCWDSKVNDFIAVGNGREGALYSSAANAAVVQNSIFDSNSATADGYCGLTFSGASASQGVRLEGNDISTNGTTVGVSRTFSAGLCLLNVQGATVSSNYIENNLTNSIYATNANGLAIQGNFINDSAIYLNGADYVDLSANFFFEFDSIPQTITAIANNGSGACRVSMASTAQMTVGTLVYVAGVTGSTGCNSPSSSPTTGWKVATVISGTQVDTNAPFTGGAYVSGGTMTRASGIISGTVTPTHITLDRSNYMTSTPAIALVQTPLYPAWGPVIASASSIIPNFQFQHISGTTQITTIDATSTHGINDGTVFCAIPDGLWTTATGGNIALGSTAVVGKQLCWTWNNANTLWYPSY